MELWVDKYKPSQIKGVIGNKKAVEEVREFVSHPLKGKALLLHGPTGIGKSLLPEIVSREQQLHLVEINASDERGKAAVESYFSASKTQTLFSRGRLLVVDEVDSMGAGDRGGVQAVVSLIKQSKVPVLLIANDPWIPKLRPLRSYCKLVKFNKIPSPSVEKFLRGICEKEGIEPQGRILKNLARFSEGDLRAAITDLQLASLGRSSLEDKDLEAIGFRERGASLFNTLPTIFRSSTIASSRKLIFDGDKDPDEVLWWIENNAHKEFPKEKLVDVFDALSKADLFRSRVMKQQNWAFKGYMVDMMAGVSVFHPGGYRYVSYKAPDRFIQLGRTKQKRAMMKSVCERLGKELHCSKKRVREDVIPYLRIILKHQDLGLDQEDIDIIMG